MKIPEEFENHYERDVVLRFKRTIFGLKQAAYAFWREFLKAFVALGYTRSEADPSLYYKWDNEGLILWISWVDDCLSLVTGTEDMVKKEKEKMKQLFHCDDIGKLKEYVGCKIVHNRLDHSVKFTQPVLLQNFTEEFEITNANHETPTSAGEVMRKGEEEDLVSNENMSKYRSVGGKLLHLTKWSRPDMQNVVQELTRFMVQTLGAHEVTLK